MNSVITSLLRMLFEIYKKETFANLDRNSFKTVTAQAAGLTDGSNDL